MEGFGKRDIKEILEKLEEAVDTIPKIEKVQRMKMKGKIRQQEGWLAAFADPTPEKIIMKLKARMPEIWNAYPYGFSDQIKELLKTKISELKKKEEQTGTLQKEETR